MLKRILYCILAVGLLVSPVYADWIYNHYTGKFDYYEGKLNITHPVRINSTNATAFQVNNATGTTVFNVDTSAKEVGINTATPATALHIFHNTSQYDGRITVSNQRSSSGAVAGMLMNVTGSILGSVQIYDNNTDAGANYANRLCLVADSSANGTSLISEGSGDDIRFVTAGTERMLINGTGSVGIGTSTPAGKLHVYDSTYGVGLSVGDDTNVATDAQKGWRVVPYSDGNVYVDHKTTTGGKIIYRAGEGANTGSLNSAITIDPTYGHVGIGHTSPVHPLQINSTDTGYATAGVYTNTYGAHFLSTNGTDSGSLYLVPGSNGVYVFGGVVADPVNLYLYNGSAYSTRIAGSGTSYLSDGALAIGKSAAISKLDIVCTSTTIVGEIITGASGQTVDLQQWQNSTATVLARVTASGTINASGFIFPTGTTLPGSPEAGRAIYNTTDDKLYIYNGTAWRSAQF